GEPAAPPAGAGRMCPVPGAGGRRAVPGPLAGRAGGGGGRGAGRPGGRGTAHGPAGRRQRRRGPRQPAHPAGRRDGAARGPTRPAGATVGEAAATDRRRRRTCHSLVRTVVPARPSRTVSAPERHARLRVEVDGQTLVDLHQPVEAVSVVPAAAGTARVEVRPLSVGAEASPLLAEGRTVTVSGAHFRYRADSFVSGPVREIGR